MRWAALADIREHTTTAPRSSSKMGSLSETPTYGRRAHDPLLLASVRRVLVVLEDDTLVLGQQGQAVWMRPDGLAAVRATMFMDLPTRQELAEEHRPEEHSASSIVDFLRDRLRFEFLNVKVSTAARSRKVWMPLYICHTSSPCISLTGLWSMPHYGHLDSVISVTQWSMSCCAGGPPAGHPGGAGLSSGVPVAA